MPSAGRARRLRAARREHHRASSACAACFAYTKREALELLRDPIRLAFALLGTAFLMLIFGFGITTDVDNLSFAVLDRDQTPESRAYLERIPRIALFRRESADRRLRRSRSAIAQRRRQGHDRNPSRLRPRHQEGRPTSVGAWIDGAMPFRAETIRGYLQGVHQHYLPTRRSEPPATGRRPPRKSRPAFATTRISRASTPWCPATIAMLLVLIPAILMALAIVREKELGSITNLYVTPVTRIEFLLGKQLPYIAVALVEFRRPASDGAVCFRCAAEG